MDKQTRKHSVTLNIGHCIGGETGTKKSRANRKKARTPRTYQNKITKLQAKYRKYVKSDEFKSKYPTFESWMKKFTIKEVGKEASRSSYVSINRSEIKKQSVWGR